MNKLDRRAKRSQELLGSALLELIEERGYESLTIKDLTDRADVSYVTFFRHYRDLDELLFYQLESELRVLVEHMDGNPDSSNELASQALFEHIERHAIPFSILLKSQRGVHIKKRCQQACADLMLPHCKSLIEYCPQIPLHLIANQLAASKMALIEWWLDSDKAYSAKAMASIHDEMMRAIFIGFMSMNR